MFLLLLLLSLIWVIQSWECTNLFQFAAVGKPFNTGVSSAICQLSLPAVQTSLNQQTCIYTPLQGQTLEIVKAKMNPLLTTCDSTHFAAAIVQFCIHFPFQWIFMRSVNSKTCCPAMSKCSQSFVLAFQCSLLHSFVKCIYTFGGIIPMEVEKLWCGFLFPAVQPLLLAIYLGVLWIFNDSQLLGQHWKADGGRYHLVENVTQQIVFQLSCMDESLCKVNREQISTRI